MAQRVFRGLGRDRRRRPRGPGHLGATAFVLLAVLAFTAAGASADAPPGVAQLTPNDPAYSQYANVYKQIDAPAGWAATQGKPCTAGIAVLDGYASGGSDLTVHQGADFATGSGDQPHGTQVASVAAAATDNGVGVPGISNCPVTSVRVTDSTGAWQSAWLQAGIEWACNQAGVRVLDISLWEPVGETPSPGVSAALTACTKKGILPVLMAGDGLNGNGAGASGTAANPLAAANSQAVRVAGVDPDGHIDPGSNYSGNLSDIAAPWGVPADDPAGSWSLAHGTSFSAAMVAAVLAEMFSIDPSLTASHAKHQLICSGTYVAGLNVGNSGKKCGHAGPQSGRVLDFYGALVAAGYKAPAAAAVIVHRTGHGKVQDDQGHIACGKTCSYRTYVPAGKVTLKAHSARGYAFTGWQGACKGKKATCTLSLAPAAKLSVDVVFLPTLTVVKRGRGSITHIPRCGLKARHCVKRLTGKVELTAKPAKGSHFVRWAGACKGKKPVCELKGKKPAHLVAVFA
jgi:Subtilase family/Divergent InlB B-repeat domain